MEAGIVPMLEAELQESGRFLQFRIRRTQQARLDIREQRLDLRLRRIFLQGVFHAALEIRVGGEGGSRLIRESCYGKRKRHTDGNSRPRRTEETEKHGGSKVLSRGLRPSKTGGYLGGITARLAIAREMRACILGFSGFYRSQTGV